MKAKEIRNLAEETVREKLAENKAALARMKFGHSLAGTENPMSIRLKRREIARMLTILNENKNKK